ncbi:thiol:disulfide interchange protein DsbA/DsbL [Dokdonella sp.]|uniref:thiol:disulfide interchange protein DsbA/DsbL n=1 Tax=Dokdonella sp. TaxID=2291710 RepID=UPI0025BD15E4|nr:thiol:disulfide interchange protein DsbA/DsbL [Dokdonella sp.]MBX3691810.1 thiol:disulfide interchange protein DsbA/DsbL [Dokdonella sp.]MCW5568708.1 thiol:disulfide interchange protein DsbA/DsbL [Dokdonella sp.]
MFKRLTLAFAALLMACAFSAMAEDHAGHDHGPAATPGAAEVGKNYFLVDPPQPTSSGDRVEVLEVFSYACIHCAHFQPYADELKTKLPQGAAFAYMPAVFNAQWEAYARAFYAAQSLGVLDKTHQAVFDAVHRDRRPLRSFDDIAALYGEHGVDVAKFKAASTSFEVESKVARSKDLVPKLGVDGTPTVIVNGKYRITGASAGGYPQLVALVEMLVKQELDAKAKKK